MEARRKTKLVKDFFLSSLEDKIGLTLRPSQAFFSNHTLRNERLGIFQEGYRELLTLRPKEYFILEKYMPSEFIEPNAAFRRNYALGAKGVLFFLEQLFESLSNAIVDFCGIAPLSSEKFKVNFSKEYVGKSLPDLLIYYNNACLVEIKYTGDRTTLDLTGLDNFQYEMEKDLWNKYHESSQKTGYPCFLSIVFADKNNKNTGVIGSVPINKRVENNPHIIYREDLIKQDVFFSFLKDYLE